MSTIRIIIHRRVAPAILGLLSIGAFARTFADVAPHGAAGDAKPILGRVEWPDGKPASGAEIRWIVIDGDPILSMDLLAPSHVTTNADGKFEIPDLSASSYRVQARVKKAGDPNPWVGVFEPVQPGASPIVMKLEPGLRIEGRVIDDRGNVVKACRVLAMSTHMTRDGRGTSATSADPVEVRGGEGRFVILGLTRGAWEVHAELPNGAASQPVRVTVPADRPVELRVLRLGSISGRVVDPKGKSVAGATVRYPARRAGILAALGDSAFVVETDEAGAFLVEDLEPAVRFLSASAPGFAPSEKVTHALKPGEDSKNIVLALRVGGVIAGQVVDAAGKGVANRKVRANDLDSIDFFTDDAVVTDATGHFEIRDLAPGNYTVSSPKSDALVDLDEKDEATVEVISGETVHVVLGKAREMRFRVQGLIRVGKKPLPDVGLAASKIYDNPGLEESKTKTDAEGRYELGFDRPGTHWWDFSIGDLNYLSRRIVSEEPLQKINFTVTNARLSGRVLGIDGKPHAGASVDIATGRDSVDLTLFYVTGTVQTDADGRFVFEPLTPAKYRVTIGRVGESPFDRGQTHGVAIREDLAVSENAPLEIEIALTPACVLTGIVRGANGKPLSEVFILGRDEKGVLFDREHLARTDVEGRFRVDGLPAGRASFFARTLDSASDDSALVTLDAKAPARIELKMRKATRLWVDLQNADGGNVARCQLRVFDASDRDVGIRFWEDEPEDDVEGMLVGALLPGKYRILASHESGVSTTTTVELAGESVKAIELRFAR